jgi:hypothetical protein
MRYRKMNGIKTQYFIMLSFVALLTLYFNNQQIVEGNTMNNSEQYNIKITFGDTLLTATLYDNQTTRDFISLLPLDLKLEDYASKEKISSLPKKLSTEDAPSGFDPSIGDITYYAPWGNLAIFYKDFEYAKGLINLGKIDNGIEVFSTSNSLNVRIELIK